MKSAIYKHHNLFFSILNYSEMLWKFENMIKKIQIKIVKVILSFPLSAQFSIFMQNDLFSEKMC